MRRTTAAVSVLVCLGVVVLGLTAGCAAVGRTGSARADGPSVRIRPFVHDPPEENERWLAISIRPPWEQEGEWAFRIPETLGSNIGLLFIDHFRPDMVAVVDPTHELRWIRKPDGSLLANVQLENGIELQTLATPGEADVTVTYTMYNGCPRDLSNLGLQFCMVQNRVPDFVDHEAKRTFIYAGGRFVALGDTEPGPDPGKAPLFIVTNTRDVEPFETLDDGQSWTVKFQTDIPLIATVSADGRRVIAVASDNSYKIMTNAQIPCIHADPFLGECAAGDTVSVKTKVYFIEGPLADVLPLFARDFPQWADAVTTTASR